MGMYTGFRADVVIKPEYRDMICSIMGEGNYSWKHFIGKFPFLEKFAMKNRANFIPFGALCYMPDEWETNERFVRHFDATTGRWTFACSLKNYESEIYLFCTSVLSEIAESGNFEILYEEWEQAESYRIEDFEQYRSQFEQQQD
jgi:hypothetical protein